MATYKAGNGICLPGAYVKRVLTVPQRQQLKLDGNVPETVPGKLLRKAVGRSWEVELEHGIVITAATKMIVTHAAAEENSPPFPDDGIDLSSGSDDEEAEVVAGQQHAADVGWGEKVDLLMDPAPKHYGEEGKPRKPELVDSPSATAAMDTFKAFSPLPCSISSCS